MSTLENLKKSIREMSDAELDALLKDVRSHRRAPRDPAKPRKAKSSANPVAGMSKAMARQLLEMLEGRANGTEDSTEN